MGLLDSGPFDFGQVSTQEDADLVNLVLAAEQKNTRDTKQSRRVGPGEIVSTGSPPSSHASNPGFDPNRLADQQSSAAPSSHHQTTCTVQIQPRQPECSGHLNEGRGQPKWDQLQGGPNAQSDGPGHRGYLPPAENNAAPAVLGKRKLPSSFSGQQPGQPAALSTLRPLCLPKGCITYASLPAEVEHLCQLALSCGVEAVGFDIEWRVTYRTGETPRPVAVIQLALRPPGGAYRVFLLHVYHSGLTPALLTLLRSPELKKAGVGCCGDAQKLMRDFSVACEGMVDLSEEANLRLCGPSSARQPEKWSLARLAAAMLSAELRKDPGVRTCNWETWPLSLEQQQYAALDAYASLILYQRITVLPLPQLPSQPQEPEGDASDEEQSPLDVPAAPIVAHLQPAKMAVWRFFVEQGASIRAIARQRNIQRDSVEGYIAEAITAGAAYAWHHAHVPRATLAAVAGAATRYLCLPAQNPCPPAQTSCPAAQNPCPPAQISCLPARSQCLPAQQPGPTHAICPAAHLPGAPALQERSSSGLAGANDAGALDGAKDAGALAAARHAGLQQHSPCASASIHGDSEAVLEGGQARIAGPTSQPGLVERLCQLGPLQEPGQDLVEQLQERGVTVKMLKEHLPESVRYGQIRLCLAHIGRLGLLPQLLADANNS